MTWLMRLEAHDFQAIGLSKINVITKSPQDALQQPQKGENLSHS
jgi:hypothetical protein